MKIIINKGIMDFLCELTKITDKFELVLCYPLAALYIIFVFFMFFAPQVFLGIIAIWLYYVLIATAYTSYKNSETYTLLFYNVFDSLYANILYIFISVYNAIYHIFISTCNNITYLIYFLIIFALLHFKVTINEKIKEMNEVDLRKNTPILITLFIVIPFIGLRVIIHLFFHESYIMQMYSFYYIWSLASIFLMKKNNNEKIIHNNKVKCEDICDNGVVPAPGKK